MKSAGDPHDRAFTRVDDVVGMRVRGQGPQATGYQRRGPTQGGRGARSCPALRGVARQRKKGPGSEAETKGPDTFSAFLHAAPVVWRGDAPASTILPVAWS